MEGGMGLRKVFFFFLGREPSGHVCRMGKESVKRKIVFKCREDAGTVHG